MNRVKIALEYIFSFILTVLLTGLIGLSILKTTIFSKNYIKHVLDSKNYYEKVSNDILENMQNYNMSSGLPDEIFNDIYTKDTIKKDFNSFIDNIYNGKIIEINTDNIKNNLSNNIDKYLNEYDVKITNKSYIESFINEIGNIYEKEVTFYGSLNSFVNIFVKVNNLINLGYKLCLIGFIIVLIILLLLKTKYLGSIISASGLIILFIRLVFYEKIDVNNILVVSNLFSNIIKEVLNDIGTKMLLIGIILFIIGILLSLLKSFEKKEIKTNKALKKVN